MDLQTGLIIAGSLAVVAAVVALLVTLFGSSGTTYEEALAQQKKATSELLSLTSNKKSLSSKKLKKIGKKVKEKQRKESQQSQTSEVDSDAAVESSAADNLRRPSKGHVEFAENIAEEVPIEKSVPIRKRAKELKLKPILLNKEDPSCVDEHSSPPTPAVENHFLSIHPKDEMELMTDKVPEKKADVVEEKKEVKSSKKSAAKAAPVVVKEEPVAPVAPTKEKVSGEGVKKGKKDKKPQPEDTPDHSAPAPVIEEPVPVVEQQVEKVQRGKVEQAVQQSAPSSAGKKKNKKSEVSVFTAIATADVVNVSDLMRLIGDAQLSHDEIQLLTDALLNKQHGPQHSEWTEGPNDPMQKLKKQLAEKEKALSDEQEASQALHAKLKELRNLVNTERGAGKAARNEATNLAAALRRATDEGHQLRHQLQKQITEQNEFQNQRVQMEMHIQRLSEAEAMLMHQVNGLQGEIAAQAASARDQHAHLAHQLQESNRLYAELEAQRQALAHSERSVQQDLGQTKEWLANVQADLERANRSKDEESRRATQINEQLESLKSQNETLKTQPDPLKSQYEALKVDHDSLKTQNETLKTQSETLKSQYEALKSQNESLKSQHEALKSQNETLKSQFEALKSQHEELLIKFNEKPQQNGVTHDKDATQSSMLLQSEKMEAAIETARTELEAALQTSAEQHKQINTLRNEITEYKTKNDELRSKNWKVLEALQTAEKSLQAKAATTPAEIHESVKKACEQQYKEIKGILAKGCPQITLNKTSSDEEWLSAFASHVAETLSRSKAASEPSLPSGDERKVRELEEANTQLKSLADKYKSVINETEGMLSRLQNHIAQEEDRWAIALKEKQRELDAHLAASQQMQSKIDTLQESLEQERKRPGSLADVERRLEETSRVPTIMEKLNGPTQYDDKATETDHKKQAKVTGWIRRNITFNRRRAAKDCCSQPNKRKRLRKAMLLCPKV